MSPESAIAHYRITSKLGEGGMGAVYRATDTKLGRDVAIKVLPDSFASDPDRLARFGREAQVLASLNHPNIAAIYGVEDRAIVMELVEGGTLAGPLSVEQALPLIQQLIDALEYAHDKGVVHRDLKPANIKITPDGRLKVLDFGLAKALASEAPAADPVNSPTLTMRATMAGMIMGTAGYMSPEQARGQNVDRRADIWAFGVVVYEMLGGKALFEGPTVSDTLAAVLTREPDLAFIPPRFHRLIRLCLARDVRQRLSHISAARLLLDEPVAAPTPTQKNSRAWIAATAVLAIVAIAALGFAWRANGPAERPLVRVNADLAPDATSDIRNSVAVSPDGTRIVFMARNGQLATRLLDQAKPAILAGTEGGIEPFFSPDGQWIAFFADQKLKKVLAQGGAAVTLTDKIPNARGGSWGEDGSIVFTPDPANGLWRVPSGGGPARQLTKPVEKNQTTHRWPQFLPGADSILFTAHISTGGLDNAEIDLLNLRTGKWKTVVTGGYYGRYVPSGHLLYVHQGTLLAVPFDLQRLETKGTPTPFIEDIAANEVTADGKFHFSTAASGPGIFSYPSGKARSSSYPLVWFDASGKAQPLALPPAAYFHPSLSPDGRYLALTVGNLASADIKIWDFQREVLTPVTFDAHENMYPVWTSDSKHLAYRSFVNGVCALWWTRADGAGQPHKLLEARTQMIPSSFSPDGRRLAFNQAHAETGEDILTLPLDLSDPENPKPGAPEVFLATPAGEVSPAFSPDGHWLAYTASEGGHTQVYVRPFPGPGGRWQVSAEDGFGPRWSRTGRQIFFQAFNGIIMAAGYDVQGDSFLAGKPHQWVEAHIAPTNQNARATFDVTADGKRVVGLKDEYATAEPNTPFHVTFLLNFFDELKRRVH